MTPERVLVTGAAGFIGSTLVERLLADGCAVVGFDSFDPYYPEELKRRNIGAALDHAAYELVEGDIRDPDALASVFSRGPFDGLVHLAALAGVRPSVERPAEYADVNVSGTARLFEAAVNHGKPGIVFASSSSVYGERDDGPFRETDSVEHPISPYAATKRAGELVAHGFHHVHELPVTCARIFTAYGPRQRPDLAIRKFAERMLDGEKVPIYGDGSSLRDFTYVDDLVDGLVRALGGEGFSILNFGAGRKVSVLEVVKALEHGLGVAAEIEWLPPQTGDVRRTWADIDAAKTALGYAPKVIFDEGIGRFVEWLRASRGGRS